MPRLLSPLCPPTKMTSHLKKTAAFLALLTAFIGTPLLQQLHADQFSDRIEPYVKKFCIACHGAKDPKGGLDLTKFKTDRSVINSFRRWNNITTFIQRIAQ